MLRAERTWTVDAAAEAVYAVIAEVELYPDWHPFFSAVEVDSRDGERRATSARCTHPTPVAELTTEIEFSYTPGAEVRARRLSGDLRDLDGRFTLRPADDGTQVTHLLLVDPGVRLGLVLRGPVEQRVRESVLNGAERGLAQALAARA